MTAKKAKVEPKGEYADPPESSDAKSAEANDVELADAFDAKSAEAADVGQGVTGPGPVHSAEIPHSSGGGNPLLGQAMEEMAPPSTAYNLAERVESLGSEVLSLSAKYRSAPAELAEKITEVETKHHAAIEKLSEVVSGAVMEHHDRLLELEMKVTALTEGGKDEEQPG